MKKSPLLLCILDGWGVAQNKPNNAITQANPEFFNHLLQNYPTSLLHTSGKTVGLPAGQMGNSEVGHMTIGSGRILMQDLPKITKAFSNKSFFLNNDLFQNLISNHSNQESACHVIGLFSEGGVHSHSSHAVNIVRYLLSKNIRVLLHLICDGRDTKPTSILKDLKKLDEFKDNEKFSIASISGRYYAMDRDNRTERTQLAFDTIVQAKGKKFANAYSAISDLYSQSITDEFIPPMSHKLYEGFKNGDNVIFYNFRPDRMRQITNAIITQSPVKIRNKLVMTAYSKEISENCDVIFPKEEIQNTLGELISRNNLTQFRISETEKYPHVTYFFSGGREREFPGEKRMLIPSPKIETYDLKPEMSAYKITDKLLNSVGQHDFYLVNFANADMVGHTGNFAATKQAVKVIDECIKKLSETFVEQYDGTILITADHGNAEEMFDEKQPITSHTTNPVPFILISKKHNKANTLLKNGHLYDIAPTILKYLDIAIPKDMIGTNLINKFDEKIQGN